MLRRQIVFIVCSFVVINCFAQTEKLIFAIDLIRHGDRTPIRPLPNIPYTWPEGLGQLTAKGMHEEYELGKIFHKRYINQTKLLPEHYDRQTIYVRSTDIDRTLMSAQSLLIALYPLGTGPFLSESGKPALPSAFQPIPIHTIAKNQDTLLDASARFKKEDNLFVKYVYEVPGWQAKENKLQPKFQAWSKALGENINNLYQLTSVADKLFIYQQHHIPLPKTLSKEDVQEIIQAGHWALAARYKPKAVGKIMGGELLAAIIDHIQKAAQHATPLKYILFSAHDTTILSLMSAMGTPLNEKPPYASNVNFLLFETVKHQFNVKVSYNQHPVKIPTCKATICTLDEFMQLNTADSKV